MLLVQTYVGESAIHGTGLFAGERIPKGTLIWRFQPGLDMVVPFEMLNALPAVAREFIERYGFVSHFFPGGYVMSFDNTRFCNHSDTPNTENSTEVTVASRDIQPGEEITCDYNEVCETFTGPDFQAV